MTLESKVVIPIAIFILVTLILLILSWPSLRNPRSHGFYRFFALEGTLILILLNSPFWFKNPFSLIQLMSWVFLTISVIVVIQGYYLLKKLGGPRVRGPASENLTFENTTNLITTGIYKHIRHPMYASLLYFSVGVLLKHITNHGIAIVALIWILSTATARMEERENILFFGIPYEEYMKKTKMFIPYLL